MSPRVALLGAVLPLVFAVSSAADPASWSMTILAGADSRGEIKVCNCPGVEFGGPALRGGLFKTARSWATPTLIVDGGDFSPSLDDSLRDPLADLARETMVLLRYDAVGVGERELVLGKDALGRAARTLPLVCANLQGVPEVPPLRWVKAGDRKIAVIGYLDPALVPVGSAGDSLRLDDPLAVLPSVVASARGEADLIVLLAHAAFPSIVALLSELEGIDVAVVAHPTDDTRYLEHAGEVPAMAPPPLGHEMVQLTLTRTPEGALVDVRPRTWNLKEIRRGDPRIEKLTRAFEERWQSR